MTVIGTAPPLLTVGDGGTEADGEIRPRRTHRQSIGVSRAALAARIADAHLIFAVGGRIEDETRILAEAAAAVVVAIVQRDNGQAVGREVVPGGWSDTLYIGWPIGMMRRRRAEIAAPLAVPAQELAIVVGVLRQFADAHQFVAEQEVIVHGQLAPGLDADAGRGRIVIAEGDIRLGQRSAAWHAAASLPLLVENLDHGIERRAGRRAFTSRIRRWPFFAWKRQVCVAPAVRCGRWPCPVRGSSVRSASSALAGTHRRSTVGLPSGLDCQRHRQARAEGRVRRRLDTHRARRTEVDAFQMNLRLRAALQAERENAGDDRHVADRQPIFHAGIAAILPVADAQSVNARLSGRCSRAGHSRFP